MCCRSEVNDIHVFSHAANLRDTKVDLGDLYKGGLARKQSGSTLQLGPSKSQSELGSHKQARQRAQEHVTRGFLAFENHVPQSIFTFRLGRPGRARQGLCICW